MEFDTSFMFGAATAAYQAEGSCSRDGRIPVSWDRFYHNENSSFTADSASDFYFRYEEDIENAKDLGLKALRISIAWSRIISDKEDTVNPEGIAYYHRVIDACLKAGIKPFVTLHHFDTPLIFFDEGEWLAPSTINHFLAFVRVCFREYGEKVPYWISINEPWSLACGEYIIGHFPPHHHYRVDLAVTALHMMMVAHAECVLLYKSLGLPGKIGIVHILESKYPASDSPADLKAACAEDTLANKFLLDASLTGSYSSETLSEIRRILQLYDGTFEPKTRELHLLEEAASHLDFLGINYYASHFLQSYDGRSEIFHNGTGKKGSSIYSLKGIGKRVKNKEIPVTDWDWPIYPQGLYDMLIRIAEEYKAIPLFVTENGMGAKEELVEGSIADQYRVDYINSHLEAISSAIHKGVAVKGYFLWSLMDLFSWTNGYTKRYGLYFVDYASQKRYAKHSAFWLKSIIKTIEQEGEEV